MLSEVLTLVGNLNPCEFAYVTAAVLSPKLTVVPAVSKQMQTLGYWAELLLICPHWNALARLAIVCRRRWLLVVRDCVGPSALAHSSDSMTSRAIAKVVQFR